MDHHDEKHICNTVAQIRVEELSAPDMEERLEELAFKFLTSKEVVYGKTNVTNTDFAATALTSDDLVELLRRVYELGKNAK